MSEFYIPHLDMLEFRYDGRNLADIFNAEISRYSDEWEWMKDRIQEGYYKDLATCDYIPITMNGNVLDMQIAGFNTYTGGLSPEVGNMIDFISREVYPDTVKWNTTNINNGTEATPSPYMASNLKSWQDGTLYGYLPDTVKAQVSDKYLFAETRYSASGTLTDSTACAWTNLGKIWTPYIFEVTGTCGWGTKGYSEEGCIQYPIFVNSYKNRVKRLRDSGVRCGWWSATARGGTSTDACIVSSNGISGNYYASYEYRVPVGFRIAAE